MGSEIDLRTKTSHQQNDIQALNMWLTLMSYSSLEAFSIDEDDLELHTKNQTWSSVP